MLSRLGGTLPRFCHICLQNVELQHGALAAFCRALNDGLERLALAEITLHNGGWADILDVLREKLAATVARRGPGAVMVR